MKFTCPLLMELIWTNRKHDSGTKFASPEVCIPLPRPTVNQGDARYARPIYSLSYRSIVWSLLSYCLRARDHCCVLCDVTRDLLIHLVYLHQPWTDRFVHTNGKKPTKHTSATSTDQAHSVVHRSHVLTTAWENNPENQTWWVKFIFSFLSYEYIEYIWLIIF